jgi:hypothetical protein
LRAFRDLSALEHKYWKLYDLLDDRRVSEFIIIKADRKISVIVDFIPYTYNSSKNYGKN